MSGPATPMGLHPLDRATRVRRSGGVWEAGTSPDYWAFIGPYGGATAATVLAALLDHPDRLGEPVSLTVNYCAPVAQGGYLILPRLVRATRTMKHWSIELRQGTDPAALVTATAVFALRKPTWSHQPLAAPTAAPPEQLPAFPTWQYEGWVAQYDMHFASGAFQESATELPALEEARSVVWLRDRPARPLDFLSLTAMSDAFLPRVFKVRGNRRLFGTISLTVCFHAGQDDLPTEPGTFVLGAVDARSFNRGFADQTAELFAADGRLLATSHQLTFFRD